MRGILRRPEPLVLPSSETERATLIATYRRRIWGLSVITAIVATLPTWVSFPYYPSGLKSALMVQLIFALAYISAYAIATPFYVRHMTKGFRAWFDQEPEARDVALVEGFPRRTAGWQAVWWAGLVPYAILQAHFLPTLPLSIIVVGTFGTVVGSAPLGVLFTYLLTERTARTLVGLANRGAERQRSKRSSTLRRLLFAIGAGAAPMLALCMSFYGLNEGQRATMATGLWPQVLVVVLGLFAIALVAVRSVTEPVDEIRRGFARMKAGDLDVEVEVDEPGELGELQVGFNDMIKALREREQMRDVFVRLVGRDVAEHALEHSSELTAEVRDATAMFVDIVGSTPLAESSSPREYLTTLNSFFDVVVRGVEANGGYVNQFQGDGALCVFGAPSDQPDHAIRALRAARELRSQLDDFATTSGILAVIGVSTGDVIAGDVGTSDRYEFTVVGDAVNEAKRLAEQAKTADGKVLVSDATIRSAQGELANWSEEAVLQLRGRSGETVAFAPKRSVSDPRNAPTA